MRINSSKKLVMLAVAILAVMATLHVALAIAPSFTPPINNVTFNIAQGQEFYYDVNATDPENESFKFEYISFMNSSHLSYWNTFRIDNITGVINFTVSNSDVTYPYTLDSRKQVQIQVIDSSSDTGLAWIYFNISNVNDPPNITGVSPTPFNASIYENDSLGFTFDYNASDPDIQYGDSLHSMWIKDGVNQTSNQSWLYLPGFCEPANRNITLIVCDNAGACDKREWNITVINVNRLPVFNLSRPIQNITWPEGVNLTNNISLDYYFSDPDSECGGAFANFSVSGNRNISIVISNASGHNVSFIPDPYWFGNETVNFTMYDGYNYTISNNVFLNVTFIPIPPIIQNITNQTAYVGAQFYYRVNASSLNRIPLTYYDNTSLFDIEASTGRITFTPNGSAVGNHSIIINVSDGVFNVYTTFNLEIINNTAPIILPIANQTALKGSLFSVTIEGLDPDGDTIAFVTNYTGMLTPFWSNSSAATFRFTPAQADVGNRTIRVNATDSKGATSIAIFNLEVQNVHLPPTFNQTLTIVIVKTNRTTSIQLNASSDEGFALNFTHNASASVFPHFQMSEGGLITIPANASDIGNHTVRLNVTDITAFPLSSAMDVVFIVTDNRQPYIYPIGIQNVVQNSSVLLQVNATDPDGDPLTFFTNSSFSFSPSGLFNFTPNQSMVGLHNISVNVSDNDGGWGYMTFLLNISDLNEPPYFEPPLENYSIWLNISERQIVEIYVNATDPEDEDLSFGSVFLSGNTLFNITKIGRDRAFINFTANSSQIGNYSVNISVSDSMYTTYVIINFSVMDVNEPPVIVQVYPYGSPLSNITVSNWTNRSLFPANVTGIWADENSTVLFNQTSSDPEGDNLSYTWYLDGSLASAGPSWDYAISYGTWGYHNITLYVDDGQYSDSFRWSLYVNHSNRAPVFGQKTESEVDDFLGGTRENINVSSDGLRLEQSGGLYAETGNYYSAVIDMGYKFVYAELNWSAVVPENTSFTIATSTSNSVNTGWSNWSLIEDAASLNSSAIGSPDGRYFRYWINLSTSNENVTPLVSSVTMNYIIDNETQVKSYYTIENSSSSYWIDLDDFFFDPDGDNLTYSFTGSGDSTIVDVWIESWNGNHVGLKSNKDGTYHVTFTATDQYGVSVSSNDVTLIFTPDPSEGTGTGSSSSDNIIVRTVPQEVPKDVEKYINLDIIVPEAMTTYQNSTIVSPIRLVNTGDKPLQGIKLSASTNISGIKLEFTKDSFAALAPGESARTDLIITSSEFLGSYEITVKADVANPVFTDTAKIIITSLEKGSLNTSQLNTKITFTKDLLLANPECLELNELLTQAQDQIALDHMVRANELIETAIRDCRYLLAAKETMMEKPSLLEQWFTRIFGLTSKRQVTIFASVIVGVFVILTISLIIEKANVKKDIRKKKEEMKNRPSS
jgi:hypothetical protein